MWSTCRGKRHSGLPLSERYSRAIVKFSNRKDSLQILHVKKDLKSLDLTELDFHEGTKIFINESLGTYYHGLWNKCKKTGMGKLHVSFV